jgi:hypothetical protein
MLVAKQDGRAETPGHEGWARTAWPEGFSLAMCRAWNDWARDDYGPYSVVPGVPVG